VDCVCQGNGGVYWVPVAKIVKFVEVQLFFTFVLNMKKINNTDGKVIILAMPSVNPNLPTLP
jgi:hypothetical protein